MPTKTVMEVGEIHYEYSIENEFTEMLALTRNYVKVTYATVLAFSDYFY